MKKTALVKTHKNSEIEVLNEKMTTDIVKSVNSLSVISQEDKKFLTTHTKHLGMVLSKTHMWRTHEQKLSIVSDMQCPTAHAKFHQAILEQKVQFDQSLYLAKDFELKKIEVEEKCLELDHTIQNKKLMGDSSQASLDLKIRKLKIEITFAQYELQQMKTAMMYRMEEVKGWQKIEEDLLKQMRDAGLSEDDIWSKEKGQMVSMFLVALTNLQAIRNTTDSGERNNLLSLALFTHKRIKEAGRLEDIKKVMDEAQLNSLSFLEELIKGKQ